MRELRVLDDIVEKMCESPSAEEQAQLFSDLWVALLEGLVEKQDVMDRMMVEIEKVDSHKRPRIWILLKELGTEYWKDLSTARQAFVIDFLFRYWGHFSDWMGTFVACEILAERAAGERTLEFFKTSVESIAAPQNALACYGIQKVAESTGDSRLIEAALAALRHFEKHTDTEVQREAHKAIHNVLRKSIKG